MPQPAVLGRKMWWRASNLRPQTCKPLTPASPRRKFAFRNTKSFAVNKFTMTYVSWTHKLSSDWYYLLPSARSQESICDLGLKDIFRTNYSKGVVPAFLLGISPSILSFTEQHGLSQFLLFLVFFLGLEIHSSRNKLMCERYWTQSKKT